ncbi:hypothetical protein GCM10009430_05800 [Aquimarina litoralis]|uniref:Uncharacterized protein n=1 Tax=Aquimarina litoralis TaxID=584605 RepID=A0ABN1IHH0_9FLAO
METDIKWSSSAIQVHNEKSILTLQINKSKLFTFSKIIALVAFVLLYAVVAVMSYMANSALFSELLKVGTILGLVAFVAFKSKNNFKSKSE